MCPRTSWQLQLPLKPSAAAKDALTHTYKGKTVMREAERYDSLRHCKWVDEVMLDAPWIITQEFLDKRQAD